MSTTSGLSLGAGGAGRGSGPGRGRQIGVAAVVLMVIVVAVGSTFLTGAVDALRGGGDPTITISPSAGPSSTEAAGRVAAVKQAATIDGRSSVLFVPGTGASAATSTFPLLVVVPSPDVDAGQYEQVAAQAARHGTVAVIAPTAAPGAVDAVVAWAQRAATDPSSVVTGKVDPAQVLVIAHEAVDGAVGQVSPDSLVVVAPTRAARTALRGELDHVPTLVVAGSASSAQTYAALVGRQRALLTLAGSDPLTITDGGARDAPSSGVVEPVRQRAIDLIAAYAASWVLRSTGDPDAVRFWRQPPTPDGGAVVTES